MHYLISILCAAVGAIAALCLMAVMRGIDSNDAQELLEDAGQ